MKKTAVRKNPLRHFKTDIVEAMIYDIADGNKSAKNTIKAINKFEMAVRIDERTKIFLASTNVFKKGAQ